EAPPAQQRMWGLKKNTIVNGPKLKPGSIAIEQRQGEPSFIRSVSSPCHRPPSLSVCQLPFLPRQAWFVSSGGNSPSRRSQARLPGQPSTAVSALPVGVPSSRYSPVTALFLR